MGLERGSGHFYIEPRAIIVARERPDDEPVAILLKCAEVFELTKHKLTLVVVLGPKWSHLRLPSRLDPLSRPPA